MLNPDLKLNPKMFDKDVEMDATRSGYGAGLVELGEQDPNVVVLCADLLNLQNLRSLPKNFLIAFLK